MGLKVAVAVPFRQEGRRELVESEFVVALSLDRDWYSPDQAKRLLDRAAGEGLVERDDDGVRATFDPEAIEVPEEFSPGDSLLQQRSAFERVLDALVAAGADKQSAVAAINDCQDRLGVSIEAAAVVHARREGVDPSEAAERAIADLRETGGDA
jgi:hypothetical protein